MLLDGVRLFRRSSQMGSIQPGSTSKSAPGLSFILPFEDTDAQTRARWAHAPHRLRARVLEMSLQVDSPALDVGHRSRQVN